MEASRRDAQRVDARTLLQRAFYAAVAAADPGRIPDGVMPEVPSGRIVVVGAGKAAAAMAAAVERHYGSSAVIEGVVIVPHRVTSSGKQGPAAVAAGAMEDGEGGRQGLARIDIAHASHPLPDERSVAASERILRLVHSCGENDRLLVLLSGGGSALLCAPDGLTLSEKVQLNEQLLASGARIEEMNAVRKHLSRVKGGRLALAARPTPVTTLVLSDVVGDDLSSVASGPTVADPTTYSDALAVLDRHGIESPAARRVLEEGLAGNRPETPKPGDPLLDHVSTFLSGNNQGSLEAAVGVLSSSGFPTRILSSSIVGEAREAGKMHAAIARQVIEHGQPFAAPCALVSGGETTVTVRADGRGGRNSEFALGLALELPADAPIWALAADTDGRDGSEENAGVFISPELLSTMARPLARAQLDSNDSYPFFARADHLFTTGATGTNVNDLRILLIGHPSGFGGERESGGR